MIRLTLNPQSDPVSRLFHQSSIVVGSDSSLADFFVPKKEDLSIHLKLAEHQGAYFLFNEANDPFVSINGRPFGKKQLNTGDLILVHETPILFENLHSSSSEKHLECVSQPCSLPSLKEEHAFSLSFEEEVKPLQEGEFDEKDVEHYLHAIEEKKENPMPQPLKPPALKSLKDAYLKDLEDEIDHTHSPKSEKIEHGQFFQAWKWILFFIFSILLISGIAGTIVYFSLSDKTEAQETKAAQGVADLAMALTYAKLNHLKPPNQNWSNVEFLRSNLQALLPDSPSYASQIDSQGQFNCCPFTLRVYTSSDLSDFLLIAQPAPNLFYWLIPQSIIIVDSHLMELRTIKDIRGLNRLLANPEPLEGLNGKEITHLIKQGGLIPLSALAADSGNPDFNPPKNLAWILPGAENLLYNAPRYFRLGQNVVQKANQLSSTKGSSQDVAILKQEVEKLSSLNHIILYTDQGLKSAEVTRKSVTMFAPSDHLTFGYILFNARGKIHQAHLLKEEEEEQNDGSLALSKQDNDKTMIAYQPEAQTIQNTLSKPIENPNLDRNHPIYIQLRSLVVARENELKPLVAALFNLVNQELVTPRGQFQVEYQNLSHTYLMTNAKHKKALREALDALYKQYENIPIHQFFSYIRDLHLDHLIQQNDDTLTTIDENCQQNMETLLAHIENSQSIAELNNIVHIASSWINFDYIKDPNELVKYQNLFRNQLLEQLERCVLTQKGSILIKEEDKEVLQDILNHERLIKPEERDFFLQEFEEKFHPHNGSA